MAEQKKQNKTSAENRKAFHDYFIEESFEAGIELCGTEVKALRAGGVNLKDAWCSVVGGEMFVNGMHISPYDKGNIFNRDPLRVRRLLMHKREIMRLYGIVKQDGYSLIPIFNSLLLCVQMMFSFMLTDENSSMKVCKHCGKAFVATRSNVEFCSPQCKNQYNVYKSRAKKNDTPT